MISDVQSSIVSVESIAVASTHDLSGVIYDTDDEGNVYIFTECSYVRFADEINITFDNSYTVPAQLFGYDSSSDLALLMCKTEFEVTPVNKGLSSLVEQGESVVLLGGRNARTMTSSVSSAISSSSGYYRISADSLWISEVLELDREVYSDQIGGGLFNYGGDLIGLLVNGPSGSITDKGYAVAVDEMKIVYSELRENGTVSRGCLGICGRSIADLRSYEKNIRDLQLDLDSGILITYIYPEASVNEVLQTGDVLTALNSEEIMDFADLREKLYEHDSGETVQLEILRNGETFTESVTLQ